MKLTVRGANQTGSDILCRVEEPGKILMGMRNFQFDGVESVHPLTLRATGIPQTFMVTGQGDREWRRGDDVRLRIHPAIIPSGPYQNCTGSPYNGAVVDLGPDHPEVQL
jgi:hypothetical protein